MDDTVLAAGDTATAVDGAVTVAADLTVAVGIAGPAARAGL
ncbi:hypothetical protein [Streptosporangium lutulentum]